MLVKSILSTAALSGLAVAAPADLESRQTTCPGVHVFGARETTAPAGYGSSSTVVNLVLGAYSGSTSEAINYPACGGQSSCGSVSYANSVVQGISAITSAVNSYASKCPSTKLVIVGYSQGGQITDDSFCGGGDSSESYSNTAVTFSAAAVANIKAVILMGDPRYVAGLPYNVGTCTAGGVRPTLMLFYFLLANLFVTVCSKTIGFLLPECSQD